MVEFVRIEYNNSKPANAKLEGHREIISEYCEKGYSYNGYIPVKIGPSGKVITIDLIFEKR